MKTLSNPHTTRKCTSERAPPRKRKDDTVESQQPLFLRKTFNMISSCPEEICCWSADGDSFIIKNVGRFTEEIIPNVYKHSKFPSFVRQLNFYGFRKVRADLTQHASWWEFKHPCFRRDEPELMSEIKKSVHFAENQHTNSEGHSSSSGEVESLRNEMFHMQERMESMERHMQDMVAMMDLMKSSMPVHAMSPPPTESEDYNSIKKRKTRTSSQSLSSLALPLSAPLSDYSYEQTAVPAFDDLWGDLDPMSLSILSDTEDDVSGGALMEFSDKFATLSPCDSPRDSLTSSAASSPRSHTIPSEMVSSTFNSHGVIEAKIHNDAEEKEVILSTLTTKESMEAENVAKMVLSLPVHLQDKFVENLAVVLGERLAEHLSKQVDEVHCAIVEASAVHTHALEVAPVDAVHAAHTVCCSGCSGGCKSNAAHALASVIGAAASHSHSYHHASLSSFVVPSDTVIISPHSSTVKINADIEGEEASDMDYGLECCSCCSSGGVCHVHSDHLSDNGMESGAKPLSAALWALFTRLGDAFHHDFEHLHSRAAFVGR